MGLEFCVLVDPVKGVVRGLMPPELAICASAGGSGGVALVEGLNEQSFDDGLTADVQVFGVFEFFQHSGGEIYALDGLAHFAGVRGKGRRASPCATEIRFGISGLRGFLLTRHDVSRGGAGGDNFSKVPMTAVTYGLAALSSAAGLALAGAAALGFQKSGSDLLQASGA